MRLRYDAVADAAYHRLRPLPARSTIRLDPDTYADYSATGLLVGLELLAVSRTPCRCPIPDASFVAACRRCLDARIARARRAADPPPPG